MSVEAAAPLGEAPGCDSPPRGLSTGPPPLLLLAQETPGTRANWATWRVKSALSSLKFAAHAVFGCDLNGGKDGYRVWVRPGTALHRLLAWFPPSPSPASRVTVPWAASPHAAWAWDAAEIVYTLWSLVLLEDSQ